jgi:hypothetical protein
MIKKQNPDLNQQDPDDKKKQNTDLNQQDPEYKKTESGFKSTGSC